MTKTQLENAVELLEKSDIFKNTDRSLIKTVLQNNARLALYSKGEAVFNKDSAPSLCLIYKGEARVKKGETVISHLKQGDIFGAAFLYGENRLFLNEVSALTDLKVIVIDKEGVDLIISFDKNAALNYIIYLSERVTFLNSKIEGYTKPSAGEKLMLYLEKHCCENGDECFISVSMTELSSVLGISRASLYRVMADLENSGKIKRNGKKIYLQTKSAERK